MTPLVSHALCITDGLSEGTLCTLNGKPVRISEALYDLTSGEIDDVLLEEVE